MTAPRSLAEDLRRRDDDRLATLFTARPDLIHPAPSDFTALAARATTGPSVSRCLDMLSALDLYVLSVAARLSKMQPVPGVEIRDAVLAADRGLDAAAVDRSLAMLVDLALVWGDAESLRAIHPVHEALADAPVPEWPLPDLHSGRVEAMAAIDARGGVHAHEAISHVRDLCDAWSTTPPGVLRSGGMSLRDFAQAARTLNADPATTSAAIELAAAAHLIADDEEEQPSWAPTDAYDAWLEAPAAQQWRVLAEAWLALPRLPSLATERTNVLSADLDRRAVVGLRRAVLLLIAEAPAGAIIERADVKAVLDARSPRRAGQLRDQVVEATLAEGDALGVLAGGALTTAGRALVAGDAKSAQKAMAAAMPHEIDHVLIQADLTVIAPGPVVPEVGRTLRLLADVESRGHATVFRISEQSLQRAIDAGWDASRITRELEAISTTGIPQPLAYLVADTARRHGSVRVGMASAYIRCDDEATLSTMIADRRLRHLGLSRIGDGTIVSQAPSGEVIDALRAAGYAPAAEAPDGSVVTRRPHEHRARTPRPRKVTTRSASTTLVVATLRALRAGDRASTAPRRETITGPAGDRGVQPTSSAATVAALKQAIADTEPVWVAYADSDGTTTEQIIDPIRLGGGTVTAFDHRTEQVRTFMVARISGVARL